MENWQKLIHVLVEIWTDEDIKSERWKRNTEESETERDSSEEHSDESKEPKKCA